MAERNIYATLSGYDHIWDNLTGKGDVSEAETILLALIEKVDAEYNNETFEKVLAVLGGINDAAELINKIDSLTGGALGVAANSEWANYVSALKTIIAVGNYGNKMYEYFVEGYAAIISAQQASVYYGAFLDDLIANCPNDAVKEAAANIKVNISQSYDEAVEELLKEIADIAAKDAVGYGIEIAMDSWTVTAAIKTAYNTVSGIAKKVFNTTDKYKYMTALVILKDIELSTPAYVAGVLDGEDAEASDFALNIILTIRETGENMLLNLGKVVEDTYAAKLLNNVNYSEIKAASAKGEAIVALLRDIINAEETYTTFAPYAYITTQRAVSVYKDGEIIASFGANKIGAEMTDDYAYASTYNSIIGGTVTVVVPFAADVTADSAAVEAPASSSSGTEKLSFFQRLINAIKEAFAKLFSFGK